MCRDIFPAKADPSSRAIIALITLQVMILNDIAENFKTVRQAVLTNLPILTKCELVKQAHKGFEIYEILEIKKLSEINKWPELFRKLRK